MAVEEVAVVGCRWTVRVVGFEKDCHPLDHSLVWLLLWLLGASSFSPYWCNVFELSIVGSRNLRMQRPVDGGRCCEVVMRRDRASGKIQVSRGEREVPSAASKTWHRASSEHERDQLARHVCSGD